MTRVRDSQKNTALISRRRREDESIQSAYGATALPMLALIDRARHRSLVRFSPDEENFKRALADSLHREVSTRALATGSVRKPGR